MMLKKNEIVDKLFDECEDQIGDTNVKGLLDWFEVIVTSPDISVDTKALSDVFITLFTNILSSSELEQNKNIFGPYFYVLLAYHMHLSDIILNFPDKFYYPSLTYWINKGITGNLTFNTITIETINSSIYPLCSCVNCYVDIPKRNSSSILCLDQIECKNLDIKSFNVGDDGFIRVCSVENITYENSCTTQIKLRKTIVYTIPKIDFHDNSRYKIKSIILPNIEILQIPRWMHNINDDLTIYKSKGQKVSVYSVNKEWLLNHIKSI